MVQNETQSETPKPWLDLDRPTAAQVVVLLLLALAFGATLGLLFS